MECTDIYNASCEIFQLGDVINKNMGEVRKVDDGCVDGMRRENLTGIDSESGGWEVLGKVVVTFFKILIVKRRWKN